MKRFIRPLQVGILITLICGAGVCAQEPQDENSKAKPAGHAIIFDSNQNPDVETDPNALRPDTSPLTGLQYGGIGRPEFRHSYWVPGVQVADTAQSNGGRGWSNTVFRAADISRRTMRTIKDTGHTSSWDFRNLSTGSAGSCSFSINSRTCLRQNSGSAVCPISAYRG